MNWKYQYSSMADATAQEALANAHIYSHRRTYEIETIPEAISPAGNGFLRAVEATYKKGIIRIRVIIKAGNGVNGINVLIPCDKSNQVLYHKYRQLRCSIRNSSDKILVTFPKLKVSNSRDGFYLLSTDFKEFDPEHPAFPRLFELI